jgi:hypothetical protein
MTTVKGEWVRWAIIGPQGGLLYMATKLEQVERYKRREFAPDSVRVGSCRITKVCIRESSESRTEVK